MRLMSMIFGMAALVGVALAPAAGFAQDGKEAGAASGQEPWEIYEQALAYHIGDGVEVDYAEATRLYHLAADGGSANAYYGLGYLYWFSTYWDGNELIGDDAEAVRWFHMASDEGVTAADYYLGAAYQYGYGVEIDYPRGAAHFETAAADGDPHSMRELGFKYRDGMGVPVDLARAEAYFRDAAELGEAISMYTLGYLRSYPDSGKVDHDQGSAWFLRAFDAGHEDAGYALALAHVDGLGLPVDHAQAAVYWLEAVRRGSVAALDEIKTNSEAWPLDVRQQMQRLLAAEGLYSGPTSGRFTQAMFDAADRLAGL